MMTITEAPTVPAELSVEELVALVKSSPVTGEFAVRHRNVSAEVLDIVARNPQSHIVTISSILWNPYTSVETLDFLIENHKDVRVRENAAWRKSQRSKDAA